MITGRELLESLVGRWTGTYRVWLQPSEIHTECRSSLEVTPVLGGRFVRGEYDWLTGTEGSAERDGQLGSFLLGRNGEAEWQMAWVDSWHNGDSIMFATGGPAPLVTGTYPTGAEPWSWRTEFDVVEPDHLVITAYNISPGGDEERATEADYRRI